MADLILTESIPADNCKQCPCLFVRILVALVFETVQYWTEIRSAFWNGFTQDPICIKQEDVMDGTSVKSQ